MTAKPQEKARTPHQRAAPTQEEMHAVYQCHTLAQILLGQLTAHTPQVTPTPYGVVPEPMTGAPAPTAWPPAGQDFGTLPTHDPFHG